ncbi:MAG TPA: ADP-forming succinate--CoA ligase subunit beta [Gemmatimonadota bacterium]|nr:ADP-forming succinate--CoA ligase subunit beta [Gemmatimonadota bacterium]
MKIHEYQAREIFRAHGLPVPPHRVAETPEGAEAAASELGGQVVIKAQVHAGGRGKAGGVKLAGSPAAAREAAGAILGMEIRGLAVRQVLVAPAVDIENEAYAGIVIDRGSRRPVLMVSAAGGIDIEEVARKTPEKIHRVVIDPRYGLLPHQAMGLGFALYDDLDRVRAAAAIFRQLYASFAAVDASLAEVNPLVTASDGRLLAIDAKVVLDDNALFRHPELESLRDRTSEDPAEIEAREKGLSYVKLDGSIGCIVNGAGLAMATMDLIKYYGAEPANFLDIGGSSNPEKVVAAMRIVTGDPNVKAILFNIFGGITRCDDVANGIVAALDRLEVGIPIVIRLTGTNEEEALQILRAVDLPATRSMDEVVRRAIELAGGRDARRSVHEKGRVRPQGSPA